MKTAKKSVSRIYRNSCGQQALLHEVICDTQRNDARYPPLQRAFLLHLITLSNPSNFI